MNPWPPHRVTLAAISRVIAVIHVSSFVPGLRCHGDATIQSLPTPGVFISLHTILPGNKESRQTTGMLHGILFSFLLVLLIHCLPPPTLKFPCPFLALIHSYSLNPDWTHVGVAHVIASVETDAADAGRRPNVVEPVEAVRVVSFSAISSHPPDPPRFPPPQPLPAIMTNEYNRILSYYYSNPITEQLRQQQQQHKRRSRRRKNNKCKKQIIIELGRI